MNHGENPAKIGGAALKSVESTLYSKLNKLRYRLSKLNERINMRIINKIDMYKKQKIDNPIKNEHVIFPSQFSNVMGKIDALDVFFTNNIFFAGQKVNGVLRLRLSGDDETRIRQIRLEILGRAQTRWSQRSGRYTNVYTAQEVYLNCKVLVWPFPESRDENLPPGSYEFPFVFDLPPGCPGSFEGPYGNIRYTCKAVVDRPWAFDQKFKTIFNVISILDLNLCPDALRPLRDAKLKKVGVLHSGGQLECKVDIERCGYVPGEKIPLNFTVTNNSSKVIKLILVKLEERGCYTGTAAFYTTTRNDIRLVAEMKSNDVVQPGHSQIWNNYSLPIPPVNASILNSRIINITYKLVIEVHVDGFLFGSEMLQMDFPILIGTVPLRIAQQPNAPPIEPQLPTYEQALLGAGAYLNIADEHDDEHTVLASGNFGPQCPVYKN